MIGVSCTGFSSEPPAKWLDAIVGRFDLWEIFSEADHSIAAHTALFADLLPSYDLSYSVHAPICDVNLAAVSDRMREASLEETVATVKAANHLDIGTVTVHPGISSMALSGVEERTVRNAKESMKALDGIADEYGVTLAIENMPDMPFFLGRTASQLAEIIDGTDLSVCFDIGHANTMGQIDAMIKTFGDRIANIHIHDNNGKRDEHLTIGDGIIDFEELIPKLSWYGRNYIIESRSMESALESRDILEWLLFETE